MNALFTLSMFYLTEYAWIKGQGFVLQGFPYKKNVQTFLVFG